MTDRKHTTQDSKHAARGATARAARAQTAAESAAEATEATAAGAAEAVAVPGVGDELAAVTKERDDYLDHLRRLKAEFENYRKRVQRDHEELAGERHEEGQLMAGLELVAGQLSGTLAGHGLEEIAVEPGTLFDPTVHEAIMAQPSPDHAEGTVVQVLERGYLLHGKLLRPAKVIVAS